jgi:hypothetical protein
MTFKHLLTTLPAFIFPALTYAQNLPNVQQKSLRAPQEIKIDGTATEWNNQFQAHNYATDVFYTISNDNDNLYLTIQATDHTTINKILGGSIVFTINTADEKNIKKGISLTYPILDAHNRVWVDLLDQPDPAAGTEAARLADSIKRAKNKDFAKKSKVIGIKGMKDVDTLISVYNRDGIKAAATFNNKLFFTYELAINLKKLGLDVNKPKKFAYNLTLPGVDMVALYTAAGLGSTIIGRGYVVETVKLPGFSDDYVAKNRPTLPHKVSMVNFLNPTDFWGEYTLAQ